MGCGICSGCKVVVLCRLVFSSCFPWSIFLTLFSIPISRHGSPVFKVILPTTVSTCFLLFISWARTKLDDEGSTGHPYSVGAFMGFFSFLLTFRLNYAYQRYWEAATAVHQMLSKWVSIFLSLSHLYMLPEFCPSRLEIHILNHHFVPFSLMWP